MWKKKNSLSQARFLIKKLARGVIVFTVQLKTSWNFSMFPSFCQPSEPVWRLLRNIFFFCNILEHQIELSNMPNRFGAEGLRCSVGRWKHSMIQEAEVISEHGLLFIRICISQSAIYWFVSRLRNKETEHKQILSCYKYVDPLKTYLNLVDKF